MQPNNFFFFNITWYREITHEKKESESENTQSCPTLCDPMDCSLPGFSVHRIFQARVPEWVAISFSRGSSRDRTQVSHMWADTLPFERLSSGKLMKRRVNWSSKLQCCLILKNCQTCPSATTTLISQPTSHWGKTLYQQKHYDSLKPQMMFIIFQHKTFFFFFFFHFLTLWCSM